ncbi:MAG: cytochrome c [Planctomycetes bacterium]|nr:cytochrome c [Planctomycetota bacterium]
MIDKILNKAIDIQAAQLDKAKDIAVRAHSTYGARAWIGGGVLAGAIVCAAAAAFLLRDYSKRNFEYMPDMGYSEAWESQVKNDYRNDYADYTPDLPPHIAEWGTAEMAPPDGTIYRGQRTLDIPAGDDGRARAGRELLNPFDTVSKEEKQEVLARGKNLFRFKCQACHGVDGVGFAPVTKYGIGAPTINGATTRDKWKDGELFHIVTYGFNTMPSYANQLEYNDRWKLISYLRELQKGK